MEDVVASTTRRKRKRNTRDDWRWSPSSSPSEESIASADSERFAQLFKQIASGENHNHDDVRRGDRRLCTCRHRVFINHWASIHGTDSIVPAMDVLREMFLDAVRHGNVDLVRDSMIILDDDLDLMGQAILCALEYSPDSGVLSVFGESFQNPFGGAVMMDSSGQCLMTNDLYFKILHAVRESSSETPNPPPNDNVRYELCRIIGAMPWSPAKVTELINSLPCGGGECTASCPSTYVATTTAMSPPPPTSPPPTPTQPAASESSAAEMIVISSSDDDDGGGSDDESKCLVCLNAVPNTMALPCMHSVACSACSAGLANTNDARI